MSDVSHPPGLPDALLACLAPDADRWPFALLAAAVCVGLALVAHHVARRPRFPGRGPFAGFAVASSAWVLFAAAEHLSPEPGCKIGWALNAWPAIVATPMLWTVFLWRHARGGDARLPGWLRAVLWLAPLAAWGAALANPLHGLLYLAGTGAVPGDGGGPVRYLRGPLFWLLAATIYAGMIAAVVAVASGLREARGPLARVRLALLALTLVPWAANAAYLFLGLRVMGADPTPFSFLLALGAMPWLVRELRLFDLVPFARSALVDVLSDPVLVVDDRGIVIDANRAALALGAGAAPGMALADWPRVGGALARGDRGEIGSDGCEGCSACDARAPAGGDCGEPVYEYASMPLSGQGRLLHLRDVTDRHRSARRIARALAQRDAEFERAALLHREFEELALRDALTGLRNRRAMDAHFRQALERARSDGHVVWAILLDLDRFKAINDRHGHAVGDEALVAVGERLARAAQEARAGAYRLGGEEFVLVVTGRGPQAARDAIAAVAAAIARAPLATSAGPLQVTLSGGVAQWPAHGAGVREVLLAADRALYRAKAAGRDRVCWADGAVDEARSAPRPAADAPAG